MLLLRKILFPLAAVYHLITSARNYLYDKGIFRSYTFNIPVIVVGNLSTGGTGKSPMVEYLIRLLSETYQVATLSRGYKRKSSGFILADSKDTAETLGDEPFQFHKKFPAVSVAVDADRVNGIRQLLQLEAKPEVILLDDAFQHRRLKAGFYILLTAFNDIYKDDFLLPTGNLRESRRGSKRANIIIVTKCPPNLSPQRQNALCLKLKATGKQKVFFSAIGYDENVYSEKSSITVSEIRKKQKMIIAGIARPETFFDYLKNDSDTILEFGDHHDFSGSDIAKINASAAGSLMVTTEKDYVRLSHKLKSDRLFYLPIKSFFLADREAFDKSVVDFITK